MSRPVLPLRGDLRPGGGAEGAVSLNVAFVIHALTSGGAERVLALVAEGLARRGHRVTVITMAESEVDFYSLPPKVGRVTLGIPSSRGAAHAAWNNFRRHCMLHKALRSAGPEVIVSFMTITNARTLLAGRGLGVPIVVTEHAHPAGESLPWPWGPLRRCLYHRAARLVSNSLGVDACFSWLPADRRAVIHNPLPELDAPPSGEAELPSTDRRRRRVTAMGRLSTEKGFDLLIEAFSRLAPAHPDWDLVILGEGGQRAALEADIRARGLEGRVVLAGAMANPFPALKAADLFVLSSRYEGFGNALAEAMACGLPAISFDCPSGPAEIITDGVDGILVPPENVPALAAAMDELMGDKARRQRLGESARRVRDRFDQRSIVDAWERLLHAVISERQAR